MYKTPQEEFWAGSFGDEYTDRNQNEKLLISNTALFSRIIARTSGMKSVIEFGPNVGLNLIALMRLIPDVELSAVEINEKACSALRKTGKVQVYCQSILDFKPDRKRDMVFTKGVLIHLSPEVLPAVYEKMYESSARYICVAEYYNPTPVEINYRGHGERLFKRDFAGELLDKYPDLRLVDYGFSYHRDPQFPQDDITWFLMEKV
jgi:spore coat polysaccharide biosynthesis protein SpsF